MAVPVSGAALAMRDALAGRPDLLCLAVSSMSMLASAAVLSRATGRILSKEEILAAPPPMEPCPGALAKKAPLYFALLWTVSVISSFQLESVADIDTVLIVNQFVLLLAPSVFLAIRFRLIPSGVLRLKTPSPVAALAALPCAAAGALLAIDIHSAVSLLLPESGRALEDFSRFLLPGGTSILKALVLMCLIPGIVEEFAFRGVLMGSLELRHGFGRIRSLLLAALFFGAFHFLYFRIVPTAFIGILTGIAVIRSGSVFTGMIWHAAGNAAVLLAAMNGLDPAALPLAAHLAAPVLIVAGLLLMGRKRRISPGGRPSLSGST
jgi:membrane protease YdiL (CAAX protease family)